MKTNLVNNQHPEVVNGIEKTLLSGIYRFATTIQNENASEHNRYIREVTINQLNFRKETTKFQLLCKKYRFEDPHTPAFIRKTAYLFDVLVVGTDINGKITTIEHEKELQKKWELLKSELLKDHSGSEFDNYLQRVDRTIYNQQRLIAFLESDKMYGLLFKGLWLNDNIDQIGGSQYAVTRRGNTLRLTENSITEKQYEQYIFQDNLLTECVKIDNQIQYELLCLGIKRILDTPSNQQAAQSYATSQEMQEVEAQRNADRERSEMENIQEEREKEERAQEDQLVVIDGAKVKFNAHVGEFKVLNDVPTVQELLIGTIVEKTVTNFSFYDGFVLNSLMEWQDFGTMKVQDNEVLIKKSKIPGVGIMPGSSSPESGQIEFTDSGQINEPDQIITEGVPVPGNENDIKFPNCSA